MGPCGALHGDTIHLIVYSLLHFPLLVFCDFIRWLCWQYFISEEVEAEIASAAITWEKEPLIMGAYCFQDDKERQGYSERLAYQKRSFHGLHPQYLSGAAVFMHTLLYAITLWIIRV